MRMLAEEGRAVLARLRGTQDVDAEFLDICDAAKAAAAIPNPWKTILQRKYRPQLIISILIPAFQQLTGINAIMFYAPQLFSSLGSSTSMSLINTIIIGAVNIVATSAAIYCVDKFGRRILFLQGGLQMIAAQCVVGAVLGFEFAKYGDKLPAEVSIALIVVICVYVAAFAWSWGPLGWLVPSEIQPLETRSAGFSISVLTNFILSFIIGQFFLSMLCTMEYGVFFFFAGWVAVMTVFVFLFVPETRGVPVEEVMTCFRSHWFWTRFLDGEEDTHSSDVEFKGDVLSEIAMGDRMSSVTKAERRPSTTLKRGA